MGVLFIKVGGDRVAGYLTAWFTPFVLRLGLPGDNFWKAKIFIGEYYVFNRLGSFGARGKRREGLIDGERGVTRKEGGEAARRNHIDGRDSSWIMEFIERKFFEEKVSHRREEELGKGYF